MRQPLIRNLDLPASALVQPEHDRKKCPHGYQIHKGKSYCHECTLESGLPTKKKAKKKAAKSKRYTKKRMRPVRVRVVEPGGAG